MSYKALYRKYRPQLFSQIVGQNAITKTLQNAIVSKKISHAYLFCGPRGTGKTTTARIFAKALNCANPLNGEPCCNCISCNEISESMSPDVIEIDAASNNGVDEIRDIREKIKFLPSGAKYKIYIIDEVHMLSGGAFNALLKTLEEPPKHVIFILATTEPQKLPATIISRCQRFDFKPLGTFEISEQLKSVSLKEETNISDDAINAISEAAEGGMRDALSILDQVISYGNKDISLEDVNAITGTVGFDKMNQLANYIANKNVNEALEAINDLVASGKEANKIINALLVFFRDVLLYKSVGTASTNKYVFEKQEFQELAYNLSNNKVLYYIGVLCDTQNRIKASTTPNVYLEIAIIKMCNINDSDMDLVKRMDSLEEKIENADFSSGDGEVHVDNEKVNLLEAKVNQVVTEFSKLELHKMAQRLDDLSQIIANRINNNDDVNSSGLKQEIEDIKISITSLKNDILVEGDYNDKFNELENEIKNLKNASTSENSGEFAQNINALKQEINNLKNNSNSGSNEDYSSEIDELKQEIKEIKNTTTQGVESADLNEIESLKNDIEELKNRVQFSNNSESSIEINEDLNNAINSLNKRINELNDKIDSIGGDTVVSSSPVDYDLSEIKEKLETLESRMYKFISGAISSNKKAKPIEKTNGQVMLFGDDVLSINDLEKANKEKYDFDDIAKDETVEDEQALEDGENTEIIVEKDVFETSENEAIEGNAETTEEENIKIVEEQTEEREYNLFDMDEETDAAKEDIATEEVKVEESTERQESESLFDAPISKVEVVEEPKQKVENEVLSSYFDADKNESVVNKTNSTIVYREKENVDDLDIAQSVLRHEVEKQEKKRETYIEEPKEEIIVSQAKEDSDKFAAYDVKDVEQLLLDSQSLEARNDRPRVIEVWQNLSHGIQYDLIPIAETLKEGQVVAVGNKELIVTFSNVALCNEVMRFKFKKEAKKLLYGKLNEAYNYIALPNDVWLEKRQEYKSQYLIGIKKPTLTPFNIKGLNLVEEQDEYVNKEEKIVQKTIQAFGEDIVKVK